MSTDFIQEARRQAEICNACRYCEGYCSVFPALHRERVLAVGDITQLANLCHNCRGCFYACQYTAPHEFDLNLPKVLAEVRQESWQEHAFPRALGAAFHHSGAAIALAVTLGFAALFWLSQAIGHQADGAGFYAVLSHGIMIAIFLPAFLCPLAAFGISLRRYWRSVGGDCLALSDVSKAVSSAAKMKNLAGGHGDGCNFEDEDRFSQARRHLHHAVMYGFLLCFASTTTGTILHYGFGVEAPYPLFSLPKIFGVAGGLLLSAGTAGMLILKRKSDRHLSDARVLSGEYGFIALLFFVSTSGLLLYALGGTVALPVMLALHLGAVLAFFLLTPYSKMAHGFYRLTALIREEQKKRIQAAHATNQRRALRS